MMRSMTAYGRTESVISSGVLSCEIRSVNHRYLELGLRLPEELRALEPRIREAVSRRLKRGKVDVSMRLQAAESTEQGVTLDHELAQQILEAADSLSGKGIELAAIDPLKVLSWPGVVSTPGVDLEQLRRDALEILNATLDDFVAAREREGEKTRDMLV
ncbi:MAG: hypothetical protein KTR33_07440, partial [Gammaproteobacteria bacterium]|nr:hypothetical protein [Gammaproteobacteria bacterium]